MKSYTVHEQPDGPADRADRAEGVVFVKDGFGFGAALLAPLWLLANRLWLAFVGYCAAAAAVLLLFPLLGIGGRWVGLSMLALHLLVGFEADALLRSRLARAGWRTIGSVTGRGIEDCERRFFEAWLPEQPILAGTRGSESGFQSRVERVPRRGLVRRLFGMQPRESI